MMLVGVIYTSRPLAGAVDMGGGYADITIVNGAEFRGLREIFQIDKDRRQLTYFRGFIVFRIAFWTIFGYCFATVVGLREGAK